MTDLKSPLLKGGVLRGTTSGAFGSMQVRPDGGTIIFGPQGDNPSWADTRDGDYETLRLENNGDVGMLLASSDTGYAYINFSDETNGDHAGLWVDNFQTDGGRMWLWSTGDMFLQSYSQRILMNGSGANGVGLFLEHGAAAYTNKTNYLQLRVSDETTTQRLHLLDDNGNHGELEASSMYGKYIRLDADSSYTSVDVLSHQGSSSWGGAYLGMYRSRGTTASPSNIAVNDIIGEAGWNAYVGGSWQYGIAGIQAKATAATGNGEPSIYHYAGTRGSMTLHPEGQLEVVGSSGDLTIGWSGTVEEETLHLKDNGSVGIMFTHAQGNEYGIIGWSDNNASNRDYAYIAAYSPTSSYIPGGLEIVTRSSGVIKMVGKLRISAGAYLEHRASANTDLASHGQLWVDNSGVLRYTNASGTDYTVTVT